MQKTEPLEYRVLALYCTIALIAFAWLPLHEALPGNCDTWLSMAVSRGWLQLFQSLIVQGDVYSAMYPAEPAVFYGESAPAAAIAYLTIDLVLPRVWAISALVALFLASSAFGVYSLARALGIGRVAAFCGGVFFSTSNFAFANLDDSVLLFWLLPLLAVRELVHWGSEGAEGTQHANASLIRAALLLGLQLYFSVYVFIYGAAICGIIFLISLWQRRKTLQVRPFSKATAIALATLALLVAPWFAFYLQMRSSLEFTNPFFAEGVTRMCSLNLPDLLSAVPGNRLRPEPNPQWTLYWSEIRRHAYLGVVPLIAAVVGLFESRATRRVGLSFVIVGLVLSTAPTFSYEVAKMHTVVALLQQVSDLALFLRVPLRGFFLTGIGVALLAAGGIELLGKRLNIGTQAIWIALLVPLVGFHLYDNVPDDVAQFTIAEVTEPPKSLMEFAETHPDAVIAQIPSNLGFDFLDSHQPLFRYSRELAYFLWQTDHGLRTVNGVNGYVSNTRVRVDELLQQALTPASLLELRDNLGVTHIVIHHRMSIGTREPYGFTGSGYNCLTPLRLENTDAEIYAIGGESCEF